MKLLPLAERTTVATTPTARGIETQISDQYQNMVLKKVATTPTARGIETQDIFWQFVMLIRCNNTYRSRY